MSFHLSEEKWAITNWNGVGGFEVRWQAMNAAEERKEIITTVQIRKCSYSISMERQEVVRVAKVSTWVEWNSAAKCFNWKIFLFPSPLHFSSLSLSNLLFEFASVMNAIKKSRLLLWPRTDSQSVVFQEKSQIILLNDPLNKRNFPSIAENVSI